jgi:hypothetical protein
VFCFICFVMFCPSKSTRLVRHVEMATSTRWNSNARDRAHHAGLLDLFFFEKTCNILRDFVMLGVSCYLGVMLACHKACLATVAMLLANCCWRLTKMVSIERLPALADFCQRFIFVTEVFSLQFYTCYILPYVCHILMLFV